MVGENENFERGVATNEVYGLLLFDRDFRLQCSSVRAARLLGLRRDDLKEGLDYDEIVGLVATKAPERAKALPRNHRSTEPLCDGGSSLLAANLVDLGGFGVALTLREPEDAQRRYRLLTEMTSDWIWTMDPELRFTGFSQRYEEIDDFPVATRLGKTRWELTGVEDPTRHPLWRRHLRDMKARRRFRNFRYSDPDAKGRMRHFRISGAPIFSPDGKFRGYHGVANEDTAELEALRELEKAKEAAAHASRSQSDFLANVSHELRTPLNAIMGFSETLLLECFGPLTIKQQEYLRDVHSSGSLLLSLINNILDLSTIQAAKTRLVREPVDLTDLLESCARVVAGCHAERGPSLNLELDSALPTIEADARKLYQIVTNLLTNACKFTPAGGRVTLRTRRTGAGWTEIVVQDTGVGIDPDDLPRVVQPFYRAEGAFARSAEGTGLGLPLAKALVELHGGELILKSMPGRGTTATVRLPP